MESKNSYKPTPVANQAEMEGFKANDKKRAQLQAPSLQWDDGLGPA